MNSSTNEILNTKIPKARKFSYVFSKLRSKAESNPWPADNQAGFLSIWAITMVLVWSGFKPIAFFRFPHKVLFILNIFQIM